MKYSEHSRAFASFSGICAYNCLHCYTFSDNFANKGKECTEHIISDLKKKDFNIVYISGYKENFLNPMEGLSMIETIYETFHCDLLLTTRTAWDNNNIKYLSDLNQKMRFNGNKLYFCISIPAYKSYKLLEPNPIIPTPKQRIEFLKQIHNEGIITLLTIRPLCPNDFIPISESLDIIKEVKGYCSAVISSGIVVNNVILKRLKNFPNKFNFEEKKLMDCLNNDIIVKYVNVEKELEAINSLCIENNIPFFKNSLPAINYLFTHL